MTRREFVEAVAGYGGAALSAMTALGLMPPPSAYRRPDLRGTARNQRVVILGGGLAGMAAAYELLKVGYDCRILEARARPGGRCWTARAGTVEAERDGTVQTVPFDAGLYMNMGPGRIPQHHEATISYCRELGVPLEVFNIYNTAAYYYAEGTGPLSGRRVRAREAQADMRGYASELLAKALHRDRLDVPLTAGDKEALLEFLRSDGGLSPDFFYKGSSRRGYRVAPGAGAVEGEVDDPFDLQAMIQAGFCNFFRGTYSFNMQPTMFQAVGGMDRIAYAFADRVGTCMTYGAAVDGIYKTPDGVRITYTEADGTASELLGDYCICTIPLSVLRDIPADFSAGMKQAIGAISYSNAVKVGFQFHRRFWEEDDQIFGGITHTTQGIRQIWYPSHEYLTRKGVLVGCYTFGDTAEELGKMAPPERVARALDEGSRIHPQYPEAFEGGFSVAWQNTRYSHGGWASYTEEDRKTYYPRLIEPDGPIYLAGEHLSYLTGWMAGAFESSRRAVTAIHQHMLSASHSH